VLNSFVPGLGTGLNSALPFVANLGKKARKIHNDWSNDSDYLKNQISNFTGCQPQVQKGIHLARRPENLHSRIQLKSLPVPDEYLPHQKSYVEEIDEYD
jgi:hypothetical protein